MKSENLTSGWVLLDIDFYDEGIVKGVRMIFDEIDDYKSDMGISNINFEFIAGEWSDELKTMKIFFSSCNRTCQITSDFMII